MNNIIEYSNELHRKAARLIDKFPFQQLAQKHFGNITYTGSFTFNLMIDPDIDSNILLNPMDKAKIMEFANDLTEINDCRKVILYNRTYGEVPYFIINVERFVFEGETWTLTFFIQETDFQGAIERTNSLKSKITLENRGQILQIKNWRAKNNLKAEISSVFVYEAVLDDGITTIESFKNYVIARKPELKEILRSTC